MKLLASIAIAALLIPATVTPTTDRGAHKWRCEIPVVRFLFDCPK